ncbi:class I SAM-dependent methyltransferase [Streptomyces spinosisporus]|uniref:Class I SAM-dependent methyltransferase n=1 Tax=Streptomyces spinosisporus TaxID=2927582 RepID=A0ABS9XLE0_9ACTN|nr:class I SAM-dependent methyltransferase [Streptomyces spinosisporus]MCI3242889.1 class I SAM-dependent methyltransferase [Streptomyces spinosisporus]
MIHEDPLAYAIGLEGLALLRAFTGGRDRAFVEARLAEIRELLDDESLGSAAVDVVDVGTVDGYEIWSRTYDGPNSAFDFDEPVIGDILDGIPPGDALDAACGTGRMAALLAPRGHRVVGVDSSPDMLARARARVPEGDFRPGTLQQLPVANDSVDLVVCSLALTHVRDLGPVMEQFARVLRPGGHLVISDMHHEWVARGMVPPVRLPDGTRGRLTSYRHPTGDYLRAALSVGLQVRRCEEPLPAKPSAAQIPSGRREPGPWELWPWCLADLVPEAAEAANEGTPVEVIWHFQLAGT